MASKGIDIDGINEIEAQNTKIDELETEDVNLMFLAIDESGSMNFFVDPMKKELETFKKSIIDSKESEKILVARVDFSDFIKIGGYKKIEEFDVDYTVNNSTRLYDVVIEGSEKLKQYMDYLRQQGMRVKAVFAVFSDGLDTASRNNKATAFKVMEEMNKNEIVTAFIAFGKEGLSEAKDLNFKNILQVGQTESELRKAFNQLSKSLISQSKSVIPKKDDFFEM
jgi:hypothetical protein